MKKSNIRIYALLLALLMSVSILSSCSSGTESGGTSEVTTTPTIDTEATESKGSETLTESASLEDSQTATTETAAESVTEETASSGEAESSEDSEENTEESSVSATETTSEAIAEITEETYISYLTGDNAELIDNADYLANGVTAYFTDPTREFYYFENKNLSLTYDLEGSKVVSSVGNKNGGNYIENTMDVFVRMTDGSTYYASKSDQIATANIFKLGYYYYESRIEGLTFTEGYVFEDVRPGKINHGNGNIFRHNSTEFIENEPETGGVKIKVTDNRDPWIAYNTKFSADDYNVLAITMKADGQFTSSLGVFVRAGGATGFTNEQSIGIDIIPDGEYHTYYVPLYRIGGYTGDVTAIRLDFTPSSGAMDATFAVSELKMLKADLSATPTDGIYLNRMFNTYSDKLHQTLQIAVYDTVENVHAIGILTEIPADRVEKIIIKDAKNVHDSLDGKIAWSYIKYIGFDIKGVGIFGYIMPYDGSGGNIKVTLDEERNVYVIEQTKSPDKWTLKPSESGTDNANDFYMGHRIYTDTTHTFDKFVYEAELEIDPLGEENFIIDGDKSPASAFIGYDGLRGCYTLTIEGEGGFTRPYLWYPNRQFNLTFNLVGDGVNDRKIYLLARCDDGGSLECAAILDGNRMMLPIPLEVGKNFSDKGDCSIFNLDDSLFSETILPMVAGKDTNSTYSILNLYYNWGKYPLKQISYIQYYAPYYHMSTGVHESNCITPYYFTNQEKTIMQVLPDHRPMSGPFWEGDVQRTYAGVHAFLQYTDSSGNYCASENVLNTIGSYGPVYADLTTEYISDDGKIKVTYNHMEFPQTDENRAYYEMKYQVLGDVSFTDFAEDFSFYSVLSYDPSGQYSKIGYLDRENASQVVTAAARGERFEYVLGDNCPYFSIFDMEDSTHPRGYSNLSFMIYRSSFVIGGVESEPTFLIVNDYGRVSLSLDLEKVELKAGDSFTIYAILMPWQSYEAYDEAEPDINVRRVRENSLLNPLTVSADKDCEIIESPFLPRIKSTNGKSAEFTLSGGYNNVAVRVYGFEKLTAPVIEEFVGGEWKIVDISSFSTPDNFGYGYYYDGYSVFYDGDGTFSYAFVTTMDNGATKKFRVSAAEDFAGWPEDEEKSDPFNVWFDPQDLNSSFTAAMNRFGEFAMMGEDGVRFIRVNRNGTDSEATITLFDDAEGLLAGRYLVFKVRLPQGSASKIEKWQIYLGTEHTMYDENGSILIVGEDYNAFGVDMTDGDWHVFVLDLEAYGKNGSYKKSDDGNYYVKYLRFDVFNPGAATDAIVDFAYIGLHDSLEDILEYNGDVESVAVFKDTTSFELVGTEIKGEAPFNAWFAPEDMELIFALEKNRFGEIALLNEKGVNFLRVNRNGTDKEATITFFNNANGMSAGRYLVFKVRLPQGSEAGISSWQIYTGTEHAMYDDKGNILIAGEDFNTLGVDMSDGEWHVIVLDLEAYGKTDSFKKDADGNYCIKYLRFDIFNPGGATDAIVDVAYFGFHDDLSEILEYNGDMSCVSIYTSKDQSTFVDPTTGETVAKE